MTIVHFITHPEVAIDATIPVPDWPLSPVGIRRMQAAAQRPCAVTVRSVFSSGERKALDATNILADHLGLSAIARTTVQRPAICRKTNSRPRWTNSLLDLSRTSRNQKG
jgi:broad specificity phosphatase PhoE